MLWGFFVFPLLYVRKHVFIVPKLNRHEFEHVPGASDRQGRLAAAVHGVAKSQTQMSNRTTANIPHSMLSTGFPGVSAGKASARNAGDPGWTYVESAAAAKSLQSCPTLCDPIDGSPPAHLEIPRPWDSPGKNTGVGCHFLLQCVKVKSEMSSLSHVQLLATPWTAPYQAPPSMGFSRQKYWNGVPPPPTMLNLAATKQTRLNKWIEKARCQECRAISLNRPAALRRRLQANAGWWPGSKPEVPFSHTWASPGFTNGGLVDVFLRVPSTWFSLSSHSLAKVHLQVFFLWHRRPIS